jgi:antitoxin component YwqK of YwqJK toxin-antitoxin module
MRVSRILLAAALASVSAACSGQKDATRGDDAAGKKDGEELATGIHQTKSGDETVTEFDLNGDKKPDVWTYTVKAKNADGKDIDRLARKELDINWDGKVDISRWYDEKETLVKEALDLDFDGKVDQVNYYEKGVVVRKERDLSSAGKPSLWLFYEKGKLVRKERDTNGDGKVDYWEYWEGDQVDRIGEDLDGDGNVDKWTKNPNADQ